MNKTQPETAFFDSDSKLLTVRAFSLKHNWPIGGLRHLIFYKPDGFDAVIFRVGRKILLSEKLFFEWIGRINQPSEKKQKSR